ncbi:MAG: GNAT family N-acetyltransferase [Muribaculaceae bacterium]|nr:GNAT family N-acetyltransferase [Muribaculaceae bacterium]
MTALRETHDTDELMRWRAEVIEHVFGAKPDAELLEANMRYFLSHAGDGSHLALGAERDGTECGCGAVCFTEELPSPDNPGGRCAYLMNIYVREPFRNRGVAHAIVEALVAAAARRRCGKIYLETTNEGRTLYSSLGFKDMPDMMKYETHY